MIWCFLPASSLCTGSESWLTPRKARQRLHASTSTSIVLEKNLSSFQTHIHNSWRPSRFNIYLKGEFDLTAVEIGSLQREMDGHKAKGIFLLSRNYFTQRLSQQWRRDSEKLTATLGHSLRQSSNFTAIDLVCRGCTPLMGSGYH